MYVFYKDDVHRFTYKSNYRPAFKCQALFGVPGKQGRYQDLREGNDWEPAKDENGASQSNTVAPLELRRVLRYANERTVASAQGPRRVPRGGRGDPRPTEKRETRQRRNRRPRFRAQRGGAARRGEELRLESSGSVWCGESVAGFPHFGRVGPLEPCQLLHHI